MRNQTEQPTATEIASLPPCHGMDLMGTGGPLMRLVGVGGLVAAWLAAGDAGLLGHALRHALTWAVLGAVTLVGSTGVPWKRMPILVLALALAILMTASSLTTVNILAVAVLLAGLAICNLTAWRLTFSLVAETVLVLGIVHFARTSIPVVWLAADSAGTLLGTLAGRMTRQPLWIGASFGGLDYLFTLPYLAVMAPLRSGWKPTLRPVQRNPVVLGLATVMLCHGLYLGVLSLVAPVVSLSSTHTFPLAQQVLAMLPWNAPLIAMLLHGLGAYVILNLASRSGHAEAVAGESSHIGGERPMSLYLAPLAAVGLVLFVAFAIAPSTQPATLTGKKVVFYEKGFLNWMKPAHGDYGRYSVGMYGMLPAFVESLGAEVALSPELAEEDLQDADALVLIYPKEPWQDGQLERIWEFVRRGGSLLVMGEHTTREADGGNRFNEVLRPTRMRVRFDSATFAVGGWLQSYETLWHPITAGIADTENDFGVVIGASLEVHPPAQPLLVGRWGWGDPGNLAGGPGLMGNGQYDAGERLGDLVLAAEQSLGRGKVVVFGDTSGLSNGINMGCHVFNSRLFAYLARSGGAASAGWQQLLAVCALSLLVVLVAHRPLPRMLVTVALLLALVTWLGTERTEAANRILPRGDERPDHRLAYIDASHLEAYSRESWREDGVMGLCLNLMRNGYQAFMLPELSRERLRQAQLLVCIAPSRPYSPEERRILVDFVRQGGVLIYTVGKDRSESSDCLLATLGMQVGTAHWTTDTPATGFTPLGYFKTNYRELPDAYVRFYAAWPVSCRAPDAEVISFYPPDQAVIMLRPLGRGALVLVGDTFFAMNKNLERESGEPIEGKRENAEFWRWLLDKLEKRGDAQPDDLPMGELR